MNAPEVALEGLAPGDRAVVEEALRLSEAAIQADPRLLPSQLVGRLAGHPSPAIRALVDRMRPQATLCPAGASLETPGNPLRKVLEHHTDFVGGLVFLNDGTLVSSSEDSTIAVWDIANGTPERVLEHDMPINSVGASPNGRRLAGACDDGHVYIYDTGTWERVRTLKGHDNYVRRVEMTKGRVVSTSNDNSVRVWDRKTGKLVKKFEWQQTTQGISISPGGRYALVCSIDNVMKIFDLNVPKVVKTLANHGKNFIGDVGGFGFINADNETGIGHEDYCKAAAWTPDGSRIVSVEKEVCVWDAKTGKQISRSPRSGWGWESVAITSDGAHMLLAGKLVEIRSIEGERVATVQSFEETARSIAIHPDGHLFATGHEDGKIRIWDLRAALARGVTAAHSNHVSSCQFSLDGATGITSASDGMVKLWDLATGGEVRTLTAHEDPFVEVVRPAPDGKRLVSTDHDGTFIVWDLATGKQLQKSKRDADGSMYSFLSMVFIEGGTKALCGQVLADLTVWDLESSGTATALEGKVSGVYGLHLTKDEKLAYTCGYCDDEVIGGIGIWDVPGRRKIGEIPTTAAKKGIYFDKMLLLPDERQALTVDSENRVEVWDLHEKKRVRELAPQKSDEEAWLPSIVALTDGGYATVQHFPKQEQSAISVWNLETGESREVARFKGSFRDVQACGPGRILVADETLSIYDLATGRVVASFRGDAELYKACASANGKLILAGEGAGRVHVLRVQA